MTTAIKIEQKIYIYIYIYIYTIEESNVKKKKIKPKAYQTWNNAEYTCSKSATKATNQYKQMQK